MNRRNFLNTSTQCTLSGLAIPMLHLNEETMQTEELNVFGPRQGYTPQMSILVSMMNWMRETVLRSVRGMDQKDLDYLHDGESNTVGAMLWHLASTERFYQLNTFENMPWGSWSEEESNKWGLAMSLGQQARADIKGYDLEFYLEKLESVREYSLEELKKRDDDWLLYKDENFWGGTNNWCKWFHVVEHESNHNGQIKWIANRIS